jgi:type II secretory pathway component GspD/PulD (secretin)
MQFRSLLATTVLSTLAVTSVAHAAPLPSAAAAAASETGGSVCRRLPAGRAMVKLNLKPETDVADLVAWISAITCKQFVVPGTLATSKKVTIYSPGLLTSADAYRLFLAALDSVGLTVYSTGKLLRVIETPKAKTSGIPVYGFDDPEVVETPATDAQLTASSDQPERTTR